MASRCPPDDFKIYYVLTECTDYSDTSSVKESSMAQQHSQGVTGLRNLGNTCYMNAILQCLCSITPLVEYFLSGKYITALQKDSGEAATAFAYLMTDMWLGDSDCVSPEVFRAAIGKIYPAFLKRTQQDAQEFLIYVLNELHEALKKGIGTGREWRQMDQGGILAEVQVGHEESLSLRDGSDGKRQGEYRRKKTQENGLSTKCYRKVASSESSIITRLFEGQLNYDIVCLKCENCTYKNEVFTVLSLPIPSECECSLQECLGCFFQQDTLTWNNQIHCAFCESKQDAAVRASIAKAPKTVIFHLKRFDCQGRVKRKLRTDIHYPLNNLDLSPYIYPLFRKHPKYSLCGVVNHFGDLDGGHYTAFCKNTVNQTWYSFDDTRVCEIPDSAVQTAAAYLLFYSCQPFSIPTPKCKC
ncbi:inactive ubiquitin carboxyl-terminal hydrolase 50 isoform X2 [Antechinus flavipes]|uniref:inactive ubiquitin carboxyl-terminal hydrolase 50 isoform X2 n=1 Tax=Sarcophilus harrisii TaxID=9305 RepID=UPI00062B9D7F|nr:inactive ubiquitin carboxyl-terminal hydrolase 50 isoform X2 [Sarcophilus harrisii]XP_051836594.1 inactive ubiquitin carboxyl-terminal hydrolase 50 isoform X2 [Antechinus flavipes]